MKQFLIYWLIGVVEAEIILFIIIYGFILLFRFVYKQEYKELEEDKNFKKIKITEIIHLVFGLGTTLGLLLLPFWFLLYCYFSTILT